MNPSCQQCFKTFLVGEEDLAFYDQISPVFGGKKFALPVPHLCPECRQRRRLAYRNEETLYRRSCDLCKKEMMALYSPDSSFTVYCRDCWWSDGWDAMNLGRDFDFSRPFYEQFAEIALQFPRLGIINAQDENGDYTNYGYRNKDCYMIFTSDQNQNCYYGNYVLNCFDCVDNLYLIDSELCYDCIDCVKCYGCSYCQSCENSSECFGCFDLKGCSNCFGSSGLRNKRYYFFNQALSKEEYEVKVAEAKKDWPGLMVRLQTVGVDTPRRAVFMVSCENVVGDHLNGCKNVFQCFYCRDLEDSKYVCNAPVKADHIYDMEGGGLISWSLEIVSAGATANHCIGLDHSWNGSNEIFYSTYCMSSANLLGCAGLKRKEYCVLNKQYTKEDYEALAARVVEHMMKTGEWGEFFPASLSPYAYNETVAQTYYPLRREEALALGYRWSDTLDTHYEGKPFALTKQEEAFYSKRGLPKPTEHPFVRMKRRFLKRNPRKLWDRNCGKCGQSMMSSYSPDRPEVVYCESCYLAAVY